MTSKIPAFCGGILALCFLGLVVTSVHAAPPPDDYEDDDIYTAASIIVINDPVDEAHNVDSDTDEDWVMFYALVGPPTVTYTIETVNLEADCDTQIWLYAQDGVTPLLPGPVDDGWYGEDEYLEWDFDGDGEGIYYVKIVSSSWRDGNTGYDLKMSRIIGPGDGWIRGVVKDAGTGSGLGQVSLSTTTYGSGISHTPSGDYDIWNTSGTCSLTAKKAGYKDATVNSVVVPEGGEVNVNVSMTPEGGYSMAANAQAASYGSGSVLGSGISNSLTVLMIPAGAILLVRLTRRKRG